MREKTIFNCTAFRRPRCSKDIRVEVGHSCNMTHIRSFRMVLEHSLANFLKIIPIGNITRVWQRNKYIPSCVGMEKWINR
jgi:hypothetical protein